MFQRRDGGLGHALLRIRKGWGSFWGSSASFREPPVKRLMSRNRCWKSDEDRGILLDQGSRACQERQRSAHKQANLALLPQAPNEPTKLAGRLQSIRRSQVEMTVGESTADTEINAKLWPSHKPAFPNIRCLLWNYLQNPYSLVLKFKDIPHQARISRLISSRCSSVFCR